MHLKEGVAFVCCNQLFSFLPFGSDSTTKMNIGTDYSDARTLRWDHQNKHSMVELLRLLRAHASTLRHLDVA